MYRILVTGAKSYIGTSFENHLKRWSVDYQVDTVDMIDGSWRHKDFHGYDSVFHVAGIAHQKETSENASSYYSVNRDLAVETAKKAKADGVPHFVFLSSMSVYGLDTGVITRDIQPCPTTNYGKSKWEAEQLLQELADNSFGIAVLRPPMVYGKNCRGNFQSLVCFARKFSFFPKVSNQRSMIFIDHLCEFVRQLIERRALGVFFPQNQEYMQTSQMVQWMGEALGRKISLSKMLGLGVKCLYPFSRTIRKAFGTLIYKDCGADDFSYCIDTPENSVKQSI